MSRPKYVYIAGINLSGLWHTEPIKAKWNPELKEWYACEGELEGDVSVRKIGSDNPVEGLLTYGSADICIVRGWICGAMAAMRQIRDWTNSCMDDENE